MIAKLRKILGLETNQEKLNRFHETNNSIACLSKKIDDLAEEFTVKNESFKSLLKSNNFDDQIKKNIQSRYNNFIDYHKKELQPIVKERRELRKQHEQLLKDSSLFKAIREINIIGNAKDKYVNGDINREGYDLILKATQGKVSYSDIIIFNEEGKILLLQRANEEGDKLSNMWGVPGGHVDLGEEFIDAAKRELWEESGITCNDLEEIGVFTDNKVEIHYFKGIINSKEVVPVVQSSEVQDVKWISIEEIEDYKMPFNMAENLLKFIKQDSGGGYWEKLETAVKQGKIEKSFYDELFLKSKSILGEYGDEAIKTIGDDLKKSKAKDKFSLVMKEFSEGKLKSSSGNKVTDRDQALAIAYSESGLEKSDETVLEKAFISGQISSEIFEKASHKYIKKEPDGKGGWKYIYKESKEILSKLEKNINKVSKKINKLSTEHLYCFNKDGDKIFNVTDGQEDMVDIPVKFQDNLKGSHLIHNHPKGNSFSIYDFHVCLFNQVKTTRVAVNDSQFGEGAYVFENNMEESFDLNSNLKEIQDNLNEWYDKNENADKGKNEIMWIDVFKSLSFYKENSEKVSIHFENKDGNKIRL